MAIALKSSSFLQLKSKSQGHLLITPFNSQRVSIPSRTFKPPMATLSAIPSVGLSETFARLKKQGKVALIPYITAGDPDLSTTAAALKVLDSCGSDIIELGLPYSDPLADGPVIQAAATRALARGTNFNAILSMLKEVGCLFGTILSLSLSLIISKEICINAKFSTCLCIINPSRLNCWFYNRPMITLLAHQQSNVCKMLLKQNVLTKFPKPIVAVLFCNSKAYIFVIIIFLFFSNEDN
ncbi:hypothetical protein CsSME_00041774 [Camellia sinensis var. sinensis]